MASVYVVMGVSGCGKTTIGKLLAKELGIPFYDADDFHPQANIDKMASGIPLQDEDRWPWLDVLAKEIKEWFTEKGAVLACSALKEVYRERLFSDRSLQSSNKHSNPAFAKAQQYFIYLHADFETISNRLSNREGHFFNPLLLKSQFDTLEAPTYGMRIDTSMSEQMIITRILQNLQSQS